MTVLVTIPVFNERKMIGSVVEAIRARSLDVLVVDDGSTDESAFLAAQNGAVVLRQGSNAGKGRALIRAIGYFLEHEHYDALIIMDGDGQHSTDDLPLFIRAYREQKADFVLGNRMNRCGKMPLLRVMTNAFMSAVLSMMCTQRIQDSQCGFKLISRRALKNMKLSSSRFDIDSEMLFEAARNHIRIVSVDVQSIYGTERSHIRPVRDTVKFIRLICSRKKQTRN